MTSPWLSHDIAIYIFVMFQNRNGKITVSANNDNNVDDKDDDDDDDDDNDDGGDDE